MNGLERLQEHLNKENLDAMIIQSMVNLHYFAGFTGTTGVAVVWPLKALFISDCRYTEQCQKQCEGYEVLEHSKGAYLALEAYVQEHKLPFANVAIEGNFITVNTYSALREIFSNSSFKSMTLEGLRAIKRDDEIAYLKKAAQIGDEAFRLTLQDMKVGMTENEVRTMLECHMLRLGSEERSFDTIIASGYRSSMPHGVASDKVIEEGDFVTFDFGAIYKGYHSDMTRTIVMGHASEEQRHMYHTLHAAQELGLSHVKDGISGCDLDAIVRNYLKDHGYGQYFGHGLGHGVGLDIHELPVTSPSSKDILREKMIVTVEPGIYIPGKMGLRIEDSVIVLKNGCERLTKTSKELLELSNG